MSRPKRSEDTTRQLRAELLEHARTIVRRDGAAALTMRALAAEAGFSVGLPYKVFADRREIVTEIVRGEIPTLRAATEELVATAGRGTVGDNLTRFAEVILDSPAAPLARELHSDDQLLGSVSGAADEAGVGATGLVSVLGRYLVAEQQAGRVAGHVDTDAIAFLLAGALHNLLIGGPAWPRPNQRELRRNLAAIAAAMAAHPSPMGAAT
jgi:AcrR family transcriptional regulator